jgi:predicted MFS family arabinose efflux permease
VREDRSDGAADAPTIRLAMAGFLATAVAFGPARMGFGLFLPAFREAFALSTAKAGYVASGGFLAFLAALPLTAWLVARAGQRAPVVLGALSAALGFATVATASGVAALAAGVAFAGASAGFCWSPFNDAAERVAPAPARPAALSAVATGTTAGVAGAGALALGVVLGGLDWRAAWTGFAAAGLLAALAAAAGMPRGRAAPPSAAARGPALLRRRTLPLYAAAAAFGATNAVYLSFAPDRVAAAGGLPGLPDGTATGALFLGYGVFGAAGLATGRVEARIGLAPLLAVVFAAFAASLALVAAAPTSWPGAMLSAGLHGAAVMTISAALSFWSLRLFPGRGSIGFTAALVAAAAGGVAGPALAGRLLDAAGPGTAFPILAAPSLLLAIAFGVSAGRG